MVSLHTPAVQVTGVAAPGVIAGFIFTLVPMPHESPLT